MDSSTDFNSEILSFSAMLFSRTFSDNYLDDSEVGFESSFSISDDFDFSPRLDVF